jgi:hypothetical protein
VQRQPASGQYRQATATDNCGGTVTVTYSDATTTGSCSGNYSITRTWTATDCSGNSTTANQIINVSDNVAPVASVPNISATCPSTIPVAYSSIAELVAAGGSASDNCGTVNIVLWDEIANGLDGKPGYCPTSITRVYRFTDACGNYVDKTQTITL